MNFEIQLAKLKKYLSASRILLYTGENRREALKLELQG